MSQKKRTAQTDFDPMFRRCEDRVPRDFGSGPGCRGDRDARQSWNRELFSFSDDFQIIKDCTRIGDQARDRFCRINYASSAKTYDQVGFRLARLAYAICNLLDGWFTSNFEAGILHVRGLENGQQRLGSGRIAPANNQYPLTQFPGDRAALPVCARSKNNPSCSRELESHKFTSLDLPETG
jgi:hypothetical protein